MEFWERLWTKMWKSLCLGWLWICGFVCGRHHSDIQVQMEFSVYGLFLGHVLSVVNDWFWFPSSCGLWSTFHVQKSGDPHCTVKSRSTDQQTCFVKTLVLSKIPNRYNYRHFVSDSVLKDLLPSSISKLVPWSCVSVCLCLQVCLKVLTNKRPVSIIHSLLTSEEGSEETKANTLLTCNTLTGVFSVPLPFKNCLSTSHQHSQCQKASFRHKWAF